MLLLVVLLSVGPTLGDIQVLDEKASFSDAEAKCVALGGHLVSLHNRASSDMIHLLCQQAGTQNCWIGLHVGTSSWQWTDGSFLTYLHFHNGAPTHWKGTQACAQIQGGGQWIETTCDGLANPVCQVGEGTGTKVPQHVTNSAVPAHSVNPVTGAPSHSTNPHKLRAVGTYFEMDGEKVFLSGTNQAWVAYGYDFGNDQYQYRRAQYEKYLKILHDAGGNSIRVWIHIEGATSPEFDADGSVTAMDKQGTFIRDMKEYIQKAASYNILVFPCLWNAAVAQQHQKLDGLIKDTKKLQSYLDNALTPMVKALKDEPGLGGWDIINEMEGEINPDFTSTERCFDTSTLRNQGPGWAGKMYSPQEYLRFINWQVDAIRHADPDALVTAGSWNARSNTDNWNLTNFYSDECLVKAGGKPLGTLTFFSTHTYDWQRKYDDYAPFKHNASDYGLNRPLVVAEFNQVRGAGMDIVDQYNWAYTHGYAGAWSWQIMADGSDTDSTDNQVRGLKSMAGKTGPGGKVALNLQ